MKALITNLQDQALLFLSRVSLFLFPPFLMSIEQMGLGYKGGAPFLVGAFLLILVRYASLGTTFVFSGYVFILVPFYEAESITKLLTLAGIIFLGTLANLLIKKINFKGFWCFAALLLSFCQIVDIFYQEGIKGIDKIFFVLNLCATIFTFPLLYVVVLGLLSSGNLLRQEVTEVVLKRRF